MVRAREYINNWSRIVFQGETVIINITWRFSIDAQPLNIPIHIPIANRLRSCVWYTPYRYQQETLNGRSSCRNLLNCLFPWIESICPPEFCLQLCHTTRCRIQKPIGGCKNHRGMWRSTCQHNWRPRQGQNEPKKKRLLSFEGLRAGCNQCVVRRIFPVAQVGEVRGHKGNKIEIRPLFFQIKSQGLARC